MTDYKLTHAIPLTPAQFSKVKKLVASEPCQNLIDRKYCVKADAGLPCPCMQMADDALECNVFINSVLRGHPDLLRELVGDGGDADGANSTSRVCALCGKPFKTTSKAAKYCPGCRTKAARQKARDRKRRQRG